MAELTRWFSESRIEHTSTVGGQTSLFEMFQNLSALGVRVPNGFTLTTEAFHRFISSKIPSATWNNVGAQQEVEDIRETAIACSTLAEALELCLRNAFHLDHLALNGRSTYYFFTRSRNSSTG